MQLNKLITVIPFISTKGRLGEGDSYYSEKSYSVVSKRYEKIFPIILLSKRFSDELFKEKDINLNINPQKFAKMFSSKYVERKTNIESPLVLLVIWFFLEFYEVVAKIQDDNPKGKSFSNLIDKLTRIDVPNKNRPWIYHKFKVIGDDESVKQTMDAIRDASNEFLSREEFENNVLDDDIQIFQKLYTDSKKPWVQTDFRQVIEEILLPTVDLAEIERNFKKILKSAKKGSYQDYKTLRRVARMLKS